MMSLKRRLVFARERNNVTRSVDKKTNSQEKHEKYEETGARKRRGQRQETPAANDAIRIQGAFGEKRK